MTIANKLIQSKAILAVIVTLLFGFVAAPMTVLANDGADNNQLPIVENMEEVGVATDLGKGSLESTVAELINLLLSLLGILSVVIMVYGGFLWMTAAGNDDKVAEAKKIIIRGVVGLLIIMSAYAITSFVVTNLVDAVV